MNNYQYGGYSSVGYEREINEDYIHVMELNDTTLFAIVADGRGVSSGFREINAISIPQQTRAIKRVLEHDPELAYNNEDLFLKEIQRASEHILDEASGGVVSALSPSSIVASEISDVVFRIFKEDEDLLFEYPELFLKEAMHTANRVLGGFKKGNEEKFSGFGASVTCVLLWENGNFSFAHAGNTRMHLVRITDQEELIIRQLTNDHTRAKKLLDEGLIDTYQYHNHPDRLITTSELGAVSDPMIQSYTGELRLRDFLLLTTKGIHFAVQPQPMSEIVVRSGRCDDAAQALVKAAESQKYIDNMSSIVIWRNS